MQAACDEAGKVVKRQKLCAAKTNELLDKLLNLLTSTRALVASTSTSTPLAEVAKQLEKLGAVKDLNACTKDLHSSVGKLSKALDKVFESQQDVCKAVKDLKFDQHTLNLVIAEHLYREGRFQLADQFVAEAAIPDAQSIKGPYTALHSILEQIKAHNLQPALEWAEQNRAVLSQDGSPSSFEFRLHALNFLNVLSSQGAMPALKYARQHFSAFKGQHMKEIQRLMGCIVYADKPAEETPYADLLSPCQWQQVAVDFTRQACNLMGQAFESPLAVTVAAGSMALPALLKLAAVMERNGQQLATVEQLPIELELGPEFVYHSIFACPVSREQSTPDNPPKLLPCNHVLCEQSIMKIAKSRTRVFKCPYCPMEARADNCRALILPDAE